MEPKSTVDGKYTSHKKHDRWEVERSKVEHIDYDESTFVSVGTHHLNQNNESFHYEDVKVAFYEVSRLKSYVRYLQPWCKISLSFARHPISMSIGEIGIRRLKYLQRINLLLLQITLIDTIDALCIGLPLRDVQQLS